MLTEGQVPYDFAYEPIRPGLWLADVEIRSLRLELMDVYVHATTQQDFEYVLDRLVHRIVYNIRHPEARLAKKAWLN